MKIGDQFLAVQNGVDARLDDIVTVSDPTNWPDEVYMQRAPTGRTGTYAVVRLTFRPMPGDSFRRLVDGTADVYAQSVGEAYRLAGEIHEALHEWRPDFPGAAGPFFVGTIQPVPGDMTDAGTTRLNMGFRGVWTPDRD